MTNADIISLYSPEANVTVCKADEWWKDSWDPTAYGRKLDLSASFFEQFAALETEVPRPSLHVISNENCEYVNQCGFSKDCYLSFNTDYCERCCYCKNVIRSRDCLDVLNSEECELSYECADLQLCYDVIGCLHCKNSNALVFCRDCNACRDCIGCINLRNKQYCIFNTQVTKEEYAALLAMYRNGSYQSLSELRNQAAAFFLTQPRRATELLQCENSDGDGLRNCKNCHHCFDCFSDEDITYCSVTSRAKDIYDNDTGGYDSELCMEMISSGMNNVRCMFCTNHWGNCSDTCYCEIMVNCQHCFGCIGLRNKEYCILNKQYSKEEFEKLVRLIIEGMRTRGEWGEFMPVALSPFGYNETVAQEYFPLTKNEVLRKGWKWSDFEMPPPQVKKSIKAHDLPDLTDSVPDDILNWAIECEITKRPFKIIKQELDFYRQMKLPIPRRHPDQRHRDRMALRNPRKLWNRSCANCQKQIATSYAPERPEMVYCEQCYLETVY